MVHPTHQNHFEKDSSMEIKVKNAYWIKRVLRGVCNVLLMQKIILWVGRESICTRVMAHSPEKNTKEILQIITRD